MNVLRWIFHWEQAPPLRRLPAALLRCMLGGAVVGVLFALTFNLTVMPGKQYVLLEPLFWLSGIAAGCIFGLSFYVTCGLPQSYLAPILCEWPANRAQAARVAIGAVGGVAGIALAMNSLQSLLGFKIRNLELMNGFLIIDGVAGAAIAAVIGAGLQRDLRQKRLEVSLAQSQARALQAQINPHFFFNTLNTIQALVDVDAAAAKQTIRQLAGMFRYTLDCTEQPFVRLSEEMRFVSDYLKIEQARFADRLHYELPVVEDNIEIPGMVLQPLAENAVKHGIGKRLEGGILKIAITRVDASLWITVTNPTDGPTPAQVFVPGHALANIRDRLAAHYGARAGLTATAANGVFTVQMKVPVTRG